MPVPGTRGRECEASCLDQMTDEWTVAGVILGRMSDFNGSMVRSTLLRLASRRQIAMRQTALCARIEFRRQQTTGPALPGIASEGETA